MPKIRTLVYGSCVGRDIPRVVTGKFELTGYIARQTWISAFTNPVEAPDLPRPGSNFQARSVKGDFESNARSAFRRLAADTDVLVIDIASDRHGAAAYQGGYVSLTPDHRRTFGGIVPGGQRIPFGSAKHRRLFATAVRRGVASLDKIGLLDRTVVLEAPFTDRTITGEPMPGPRESADRINEAYVPYYDALRAAGLPTLRLPDELAVADLGHEWGPGQDHYAERAYHWWADRLTEWVTASTARATSSQDTTPRR